MPLRYFGDGAEVVIADFNAISNSIFREIYDRFGYEMLQRAEDSFFGDSFLVSFSSAMSVNVKKGLGFQTDAALASPEPNRRPLFLATDKNVVIGAPDNTNPRYDIVCVKNRITNELSGSRKIKDAIDQTISNQTLVVQKDWDAEVIIVQGDPDVSPTVPDSPAGYLKIAEIFVSPVSGIADGGSINDSRNLFPVGGTALVNTIGAQRITAGAGVSIKQLLMEVDAFLKAGAFDYFDVKEINTPAAEPANPIPGWRRVFYRDGVAYIKDSAGAKSPLGSSAGGGGGGANWQPVAGSAPIDSFEFDEKVLLFQQGNLQKTVLWLKVPSGYIPGRQINFKGAFYSGNASDEFKMQCQTTLIRKNNDAIDSVANQHTANSGDIVNAVAKRMRELSIELTSATGTVNSLAVNPGDILKVELSRIAPTNTEDSEDIRFIPSSTEVLFG